MSELRYWIWLAGLEGLRPRVRYLLARRMGGPREVYFSRREDFAGLDFISEAELAALEQKDLSRARRIIDDCDREGIGIVTLNDALYPCRLSEIYDPPLALYVRGKLPPVDELAGVAVAGTRGATPYGLRMAQVMGYGICKCGAMVVSGLTRGIDAAAATGAVTAGGPCIGVLGSAIDAQDTYTDLARDVAAVGAVISEYAPGTPPRRSHFRERNRITSGLAVAALVVEAPERSGALLFADEALSQGREVFAVPANADAQNAAGSNRMLMEGAGPALRAWDVLASFESRFPNLHEQSGRPLPAGQAEEYAERNARQPEPAGDGEAGPPGSAKKPRVRRVKKKKPVDKAPGEEYIDLVSQLEGLSETQLALVSAIDAPHTHVDDIIERTGLAAAQVLGELTLLQIKGVVLQEPGKRFSLNITTKGQK